MRRLSFLECLVLVLSAAPACAIDDTEAPLWTDTIRSAHGQFALSIDPNTRTVSVIRADDRAGASPQLRMRIVAPGGGTRSIPLRPVSKGDNPLRYQGEDKDWDGKLSGYALEYSLDGKGWNRLENSSKKR